MNNHSAFIYLFHLHSILMWRWSRRRAPSSCKLSPFLESLDFVSKIVGDLLGGQRRLSKHRGRGRNFFGGAMRTLMHWGASSAFLRTIWGMKGVKIKASFQCNTGHVYSLLFKNYTKKFIDIIWKRNWSCKNLKWCSYSILHKYMY